MKAQPGGHVEFEVGVMHAMQPPQRRHRVKEHMLEIDRKVEKDDRGNDRDPGRKRDCIEEAPGMRLGNEREAHGRRWKHEAHEKRVHDHHAEIAGPAHAAADRLSAARADQFPGRHQREDSAESAQPDERLVSQYGIPHDRQYPVLTMAWHYSIIRLNDIELTTDRCQDTVRNRRYLPSSPPSPKHWGTRIASNCWNSLPRESAASRSSRSGQACRSPTPRNIPSTCGAPAS